MPLKVLANALWPNGWVLGAYSHSPNDCTIVRAHSISCRRFCMLESKPRTFPSFDAKQDYFNCIVAERDNGGQEALMHMLLNYDTSDFCPTQRPMRSLESMVQQKLLTLGAVASFVHDFLASAQLATWPEKVAADELHVSFCTFCVQAGHGQGKMAHRLFMSQLRLHAPAGFFLKRAKVTLRGVTGGGQRKHAYELPPLLQWRQHFEGALHLCACAMCHSWQLSCLLLPCAKWIGMECLRVAAMLW